MSIYLLRHGLPLHGIRFILGVNDSFQPLCSTPGDGHPSLGMLGNCFGLISAPSCRLILCCPWAPSFATAHHHPHTWSCWMAFLTVGLLDWEPQNSSLTEELWSWGGDDLS